MTEAHRPPAARAVCYCAAYSAPHVHGDQGVRAAHLGDVADRARICVCGHHDIAHARYDARPCQWSPTICDCPAFRANVGVRAVVADVADAVRAVVDDARACRSDYHAIRRCERCGAAPGERHRSRPLFDDVVGVGDVGPRAHVDELDDVHTSPSYNGLVLASYAAERGMANDAHARRFMLLAESMQYPPPRQLAARRAREHADQAAQQLGLAGVAFLRWVLS